jgi:hypothetical protein
MIPVEICVEWPGRKRRKCMARNLHGCHFPHFNHFVIQAFTEHLKSIKWAFRCSLDDTMHSMTMPSSDTICVCYLLRAFQQFWFLESMEAVGNRTLHKISKGSRFKNKIWRIDKVKSAWRKWTRPDGHRRLACTHQRKTDRRKSETKTHLEPAVKL